jgi:hypothetical protein
MIRKSEKGVTEYLASKKPVPRLESRVNDVLAQTLADLKTVESNRIVTSPDGSITVSFYLGMLNWSDKVKDTNTHHPILQCQYAKRQDSCEG